MKMKMLTTLFLILFAFLCCNKESTNDYKSTGKITGADYRMCACCGGYYIQIDSATYEFNSLPDNSNINLQTESFPVKVKLDWQMADLSGCPGPEIVILRIKKE